jgi:uncharacterized protein YdhG (YjbR/CyaY superfamily)
LEINVVLLAMDMNKSRKHFETIDEYIAMFPRDVQAILEELRQTIRDSAPDAEEVISYQMPAFRLNGILVFFAAFKSHIGFYPTSSGVSAFRKELYSYEVSKGTIRFPIDEPLPFDLIKKIVRYRVKENLGKMKKETREKQSELMLRRRRCTPASPQRTTKESGS